MRAAAQTVRAAAADCSARDPLPALGAARAFPNYPWRFLHRAQNEIAKQKRLCANTRLLDGLPDKGALAHGRLADLEASLVQRTDQIVRAQRAARDLFAETPLVIRERRSTRGTREHYGQTLMGGDYLGATATDLYRLSDNINAGADAADAGGTAAGTAAGTADADADAATADAAAAARSAAGERAAAGGGEPGRATATMDTAREGKAPRDADALGDMMESLSLNRGRSAVPTEDRGDLRARMAVSCGANELPRTALSVQRGGCRALAVSFFVFGSFLWCFFF